MRKAQSTLQQLRDNDSNSQMKNVVVNPKGDRPKTHRNN